MLTIDRIITQNQYSQYLKDGFEIIKETDNVKYDASIGKAITIIKRLNIIQQIFCCCLCCPEDIQKTVFIRDNEETRKLHLEDYKKLKILEENDQKFLSQRLKTYTENQIKNGNLPQKFKGFKPTFYTLWGPVSGFSYLILIGEGDIPKIFPVSNDNSTPCNNQELLDKARAFCQAWRPGVKRFEHYTEKVPLLRTQGEDDWGNEYKATTYKTVTKYRAIV